MIEVLTWICARFYGRGARNRAMRAVIATKNTDPSVEEPGADRGLADAAV